MTCHGRARKGIIILVEWVGVVLPLQIALAISYYKYIAIWIINFSSTSSTATIYSISILHIGYATGIFLFLNE